MSQESEEGAKAIGIVAAISGAGATLGVAVGAAAGIALVVPAVIGAVVGLSGFLIAKAIKK